MPCVSVVIVSVERKRLLVCCGTTRTSSWECGDATLLVCALLELQFATMKATAGRQAGCRSGNNTARFPCERSSRRGSFPSARGPFRNRRERLYKVKTEDGAVRNMLFCQVDVVCLFASLDNNYLHVQPSG